jgi:hypothetical protein
MTASQQLFDTFPPNLRALPVMLRIWQVAYDAKTGFERDCHSESGPDVPLNAYVLGSR